MSRTYKDKPYKHTRYAKERDAACRPRVLEETPDYSIQYWTWDYSQTPKKPKDQDTEYHWMHTPGWWTNMMMNRPQRREAHLWERDVVKIQNPEELEEVDTPNVSRKPDVYYW